LPYSRAIVLQQYGQCRRAGQLKGRLVRAQTTRRKRISCKGQASACPAGPPSLWYPFHRHRHRYARRMGQPTQRATNYTARSNIVTAQICLHANGQRPNRAMIRQRSRRRQRRGEPHTEHGLGVRSTHFTITQRHR